MGEPERYNDGPKPCTDRRGGDPAYRSLPLSVMAAGGTRLVALEDQKKDAERRPLEAPASGAISRLLRGGRRGLTPPSLALDGFPFRVSKPN
jgi:hypothetical protein